MTGASPETKRKTKRDWDAKALFEDGIWLTYREMVAEELSHLSPLAVEYLREQETED